MSRCCKASIALAVALLVSACAGTKFDRVQNNELVLNKTTEQEIVGRLGSPGAVGTKNENGVQVRTIVYSYATSMTTAGMVAGVPSSRAQSFAFHGNKLVGYQYSSNFMTDNTNFSEATVLAFKEGVTTRAEVVRALGEPTGESVYPLVEGKDDRAVGYQFSFVDTRKYNMAVEAKALTIVFGPNDVARKIVYTKSGRS